MSLQRNLQDNMTNQQKPSLREKLRTPPKPADSRMEILENLWQKIQTLREDNLNEAEDKFQLMAYLTMAEEMFKTLVTFTNDIENDIKNLKDEQTKLLSLQSEYIRVSGSEIDKLVLKTYEDIKSKYTEIIEKALQQAIANHNRSMKALERVADKCAEAAKKAQASNAAFCRVDNIWKLLSFAAPIYVLADIVIRLIFR